MKKIFLMSMALTASLVSLAQDEAPETPVPTNWKFKAVGGLNGTHASSKTGMQVGKTPYHGLLYLMRKPTGKKTNFVGIME